MNRLQQTHGEEPTKVEIVRFCMFAALLKLKGDACVVLVMRQCAMRINHQSFFGCFMASAKSAHF